MDESPGYNCIVIVTLQLTYYKDKSDNDTHFFLFVKNVWKYFIGSIITNSHMITDCKTKSFKTD